jgi:hypothetical protein
MFRLCPERDKYTIKTGENMKAEGIIKAKNKAIEYMACVANQIGEEQYRAQWREYKNPIPYEPITVEAVKKHVLFTGISTSDGGVTVVLYNYITETYWSITMCNKLADYEINWIKK